MTTIKDEIIESISNCLNVMQQKESVDAGIFAYGTDTGMGYSVTGSNINLHSLLVNLMIEAFGVEEGRLFLSSALEALNGFQAEEAKQPQEITANDNGAAE